MVNKVTEPMLIRSSVIYHFHVKTNRQDNLSVKSMDLLTLNTLVRNEYISDTIVTNN